MVARRAHNPEAGGSSPPSATIKHLISYEIRCFSLFFERKNFSPKCGGDRIGTTEDKEGSCSKALLHILSPNKHFEDRFLEKYISAKDTIFIASAASLPAVPDALRQRFSVIELPEYNGDELVRIAQKFLIPRLLKESGIQME